VYYSNLKKAQELNLQAGFEDYGETKFADLTPEEF
jgi:hypothetical protein